MERNEIKLRNKLKGSDIHQYQNYGALMKRHKRSRLYRRTVRFFFYSLVVTFIVLMLIVLGYYLVQLKAGK